MTAFAAALERVSSGEAAAGVGKHWPLWIDGEAVETAETLTSVDPARPQQVVGTAAYAGEARGGARREPPRARPSRSGAPPRRPSARRSSSAPPS